MKSIIRSGIRFTWFNNSNSIYISLHVYDICQTCIMFKMALTIHFIKLTFYACCTGTGTGVLWVRYRYCDGGIHSLRRFRTSVGSGINANRTEKRKL